MFLVLVERFEDEHYPIDAPDPIEAIKIRMDDLGLVPKDKLSQLLRLPAEVLLREISLKAA